MKFDELPVELQKQAYKIAKEWFEEDGESEEVVREYLKDKEDFEIIDCSLDEDGSEFTVGF